MPEDITSTTAPRPSARARPVGFRDIMGFTVVTFLVYAVITSVALLVAPALFG
ncbi:hypothetical protein [Thermaerobacter composti]|uniref:MFS transporter n=1 Tax=Thermaerobacter composti TaxID=554949 RepID=A0ABZ0QMS1_9FIRM|nr:hypothetical protein [Thermaerobacter composti]WPD18559.1 hypothetical protein Q5761_09355 [Thermaerobacter composti]